MLLGLIGLDRRGWQLELLADGLSEPPSIKEFFVQFAVQGPIEIDGDEARASCTC